MHPMFHAFSERFDDREIPSHADPNELALAESSLGVLLPSDFIQFLLEVGPVWTPSILGIIVDQRRDLHDLTSVWSPEEMVQDRKNGWTASTDVDLIPFASDSMGNIFGFRPSDLQARKETAAVHFFDHDFGTIEEQARSFTELVEGYVKLPE